MIVCTYMLKTLMIGLPAVSLSVLGPGAAVGCSRLISFAASDLCPLVVTKSIVSGDLIHSSWCLHRVLL